jgi:argonaute-like protein implicated in RNA metabolism and viral defense
LKLQLIREERIPSLKNVGDYVRKLWWLSSAIYTKAGGILYKLADAAERTAFIGLAYGIKPGSGSNRIVLGSSQLFDERGEGIRFHLFPIDNPLWEQIGVKRRNPFMSAEDARRLFTIIRQDYQTINGELPSKVVVHKSTPFKKEEIKGIIEALEGINNIELLTIQQGTLHRAIQGEIKQGKQEVSRFPIRRGTVLPLDKYSFLIWTAGDLEGVDTRGWHYYQEKRSIPEPLVITRYLGKDPIETVALDILKLTKMNWNNLQIYNRLPVTVEFAHSISDIVKQLESYNNVPKDFRFYI